MLMRSENKTRRTIYFGGGRKKNALIISKCIVRGEREREEEKKKGDWKIIHQREIRGTGENNTGTVDHQRVLKESLNWLIHPDQNDF